MVIALNKPYGVISQFKADDTSSRTLATFSLPLQIEPVGRLDANVEGLLLLSDDKELNRKLLDPRNDLPTVYWAQVEYPPTPEHLAKFSKGVLSQSYRKLACRAWNLEVQPDLPPPNPGVHPQRMTATSWVGIKIPLSASRQIRRFLEHLGHPVVRLIRVQIGDLPIGDLGVGQWRKLSLKEKELLIGSIFVPVVPWRHKHAGTRI